jgi:phage terminase large subunit
LTSRQSQVLELEFCRRDIFHWFRWWPWTYDPRVVPQGLPAHMPLDLYKRQVEMVVWLDARVAKREDGLLEKSRDVGFTWVAGGWAWHKWRFVPGFKSTFGSRKGELVDKIGDPDSIFEKIRLLQRSLPTWMLPPGFDYAIHDKSMLLVNPSNGNTIRGEAGDEMGRGGRSTAYIVDEGAFIDHADRVESATSANSEVRIWASSANGMDNLFARKRFGGTLSPEQIFRFHYSDDPRKTPEWAEREKMRLEPHAWASNYEIDYAVSMEGICIPAAWVEACKRVKKFLKIEPGIDGIVGGDVGAGKARSVAVARFGPVVLVPSAWGDPDTIDTAHKMLDVAQEARINRADGHECRVKYLRYDNVGVGQGVSAAMKRSKRPGITVVGVNVGNEPTDAIWPDRETSKEKFANLKAEAWWTVRERAKLSYETVRWHETQGKEGHVHKPEDVLSLPDDTEGVHATQLAVQLSSVKWQRNERGKIIIEAKRALAERGVASPDYAEALVLTFAGGSLAEQWARFGRQPLLVS